MTDLNFIFLKIEKSLVKVFEEDIIFIKVNEGVCTIQTKKAVYNVSSPISSIESKLSKDQFMRIRNSTIINLKEIKAIDGDIVTFINSQEWAKVSKSKIKELTNRLTII